jgi:hypothetical protein
MQISIRHCALFAIITCNSMLIIFLRKICSLYYNIGIYIQPITIFIKQNGLVYYIEQIDKHFIFCILPYR